MDFQEADRRYAELKRQFDAGTIGVDEFNAERQRLMVLDDEGHWWAKSPENDEWNYYDGSSWVPGTPPGYRTPRTEPAESTAGFQGQLMQSEQSPSAQMPLRGSAPIQDQTRERQHQGVRRWGIVGVVVLMVGVALAGTVIIGGLGGENVGGVDSEISKPAPGYDLLKNDSGTLSVEVPPEWKERVTHRPEGEKGSSWESYSGGDEVSVLAVNDLHSWQTGTKGHQGVYIVASKRLAQRYTDNELVAMGPNDYSSACEAGTRQDFNRPPYTGRTQVWENCGGDSAHNALTLAAAPEGRECVVVLQFGGYLYPNEDARVKHVLDTFEPSCRGIL